jgi:hypothetical protein
MLLPYSPKDMAFSIPLGDPAAMQCDDYTKPFGPIFRISNENQLRADMVDTGGKVWPLLVDLTTLPAPVIDETRPMPGATAGQYYSYQPVATGTVLLWEITGLPSGVSYDSYTGLIRGSPISPALTTTVTIKAINGSGSDTWVTTITNSSSVRVAVELTGSTGWTWNAFAVTSHTASTGTMILPGGGWYSNVRNVQFNAMPGTVITATATVAGTTGYSLPNEVCAEIKIGKYTTSWATMAVHTTSSDSDSQVSSRTISTTWTVS